MASFQETGRAAWRHAGWLVSRMGRGAVQKALNAAAVGFVALCIPWVTGARFLSPFVLIPLACLSVFLVADLVIASFGEHGGVAARAVACVAVGWGFGLSIIFLGLVGLNVQIRTMGWLLPRGEIFADALGLSLAACVLVAGVTWRVVAWVSAGVARVGMKAAIVVVTLGCIYGCNRWQIEGSFLLTNTVITWISGVAGVGMAGVGVGLLVMAGDSVSGGASR